jgi:lipoprotein NlpD
LGASCFVADAAACPQQKSVAAGERDRAPPEAVTRYLRPARGPVTFPCWTADTTGLYFGVPDGTAVTAAGSGDVVYAGPAPSGHWMLVFIRHPDTLVSAYGYDGELRVKRGDHVAAGQIVAVPGSAGGGPLLRFELWQNRVPLDPTRYLE